MCCLFKQLVTWLLESCSYWGLQYCHLQTLSSPRLMETLSPLILICQELLFSWSLFSQMALVPATTGWSAQSLKERDQTWLWRVTTSSSTLWPTASFSSSHPFTSSIRARTSTLMDLLGSDVDHLALQLWLPLLQIETWRALTVAFIAHLDSWWPVLIDLSRCCICWNILQSILFAFC